MSETSNPAATGANETISYLPSVTHQWAFDNPFYNERGKKQNDSSQQGLIQTSPFTYGPFSIGKTRWMLDFSLPSCDISLKRVGSQKGDFEEEELSFEFTHGKRYHIKFKFTRAVQEVYICNALEIEKDLRRHKRFAFTFEAFVRPENYVSGLPCDICVVVHNSEGKQIAEFSAHRSILFEAMDSKIKEGILCVSPETVKSLLIYAYTKNEKLIDGKSYLETMDLLDAAERYQLDEVFKKQCCARLMALIDCGNALELLAAAERYKWDSEQKQAVMEFIRENKRETVGVGLDDVALEQLSFESLRGLVDTLFLQ